MDVALKARVNGGTTCSPSGSLQVGLVHPNRFYVQVCFEVLLFTLLMGRHT